MLMLDIHILSIIDVKNNFDKLISFVDEERKEKVLKFIDKEKQYQSLGSGYLIRKYISDKKIEYNEYGKPYCYDNIFFNVAHSNKYIVLLKCDYECGIDIEEIRDFNPKLINHSFNEEEQKEIKNNIDFFSSWTRKEAICKAQGYGLFYQNIKTIPSREGIVEYLNEKYQTKSFNYKDYIISIALKEFEDEFDASFNKEKI